MFHAQKSDTGLADRVGSIVAFALMLGIWVAAYTIICPADPAPRAHVASLQVRQ